VALTLLFLHGWGFDSAIWREVAARLDRFAHAYGDRGYFAAPAAPAGRGPVLAVTHSFGAMRLLAAPPKEVRGLIAINGFDCFAARDGFAGVPTRLLDRMIARFELEPEATLAEFRQRCGADEPAPAIAGPALGDDLHTLRNDDRRGEAAAFAAPVVSLQGAADPILPPEMRAAVFSACADVSRISVPDGGHLLPMTHPEICADAVARFAEHVA